MDKKQYTAKNSQTKIKQKRSIPLIEKENLTENEIYQAHQILIQNIQLFKFLTFMKH